MSPLYTFMWAYLATISQSTTDNTEEPTWCSKTWVADGIMSVAYIEKNVYIKIVCITSQVLITNPLLVGKTRNSGG